MKPIKDYLYTLYLGEYVWRYNYRKLSLKERENLLFRLFFKHFRSEQSNFTLLDEMKTFWMPHYLLNPFFKLYLK